MSTDAENELKQMIGDRTLMRKVEGIRAGVLRILERPGTAARESAVTLAERRIEGIAIRLQSMHVALSGLKLTPLEARLLLAAVYLDPLGDLPDADLPDAVVREAEELADLYYERLEPVRAGPRRVTRRPLSADARPFVTEAWINCARENQDVGLLSIDVAFPENSVADLQSICSFSHYLDLARCRPTLVGRGTERCRLLAALLQLARDLNGIGSDLGLMPPSDLGKSADQELFHACAHLAYVTITSNRQIVFRVQLNAADYVAYQDDVRRVFVEPIVARLETALGVLREARLPLELDRSQAVVRDSRGTPLALPVRPLAPDPAPDIKTPITGPTPGGCAPELVIPLIILLIVIFVLSGGSATTWFSGLFVPSPTPSIALGVVSQAEAVVSDYFADLHGQRYADAWNRLTVQEQQRDYGSYDAFVITWSNLTDINIQMNGSAFIASDRAVVEIGQRFWNIAQGRECLDAATRITLVYEANRGLWLIDINPIPPC